MNDNIDLATVHSLEELNKHLEDYSKKLKEVKDASELSSIISKEFKGLIQFYIMVGNHAIKPVARPQDTYLLNYVVPETFKELLILHREVFLELSKAQVYKREKQISDAQLKHHASQSKDIIKKAVHTTVSTILYEHKKLNKDAKAIQKITRKLTLHTNPWHIYKVHYEILLQQIEEISEVSSVLINTSKTFVNLKNVVEKVTKNHNELVDNLIQVVQRLTKSIIDKEDVMSFIDAQLQKHYSAENNHELFTEAVMLEILPLSRCVVPVAIQEGQLAVREIDVNKRVQKWFDYQILPGLMDLISIETIMLNKYHLNLVNLKNSIQVVKKNNTEVDIKAIETALVHLKEEMLQLSSKGVLITTSMSAKMKEQLLVSNLLKGLPFLEVPNYSSLSIEGNSLLKQVKKVLITKKDYLNSKYKTSINYETLSNLELSAECIAHRMHQDENSYYDSLFLNKNFIGDMFLVPRKKQETKLEQIIDQWQKGFNKSVLLVGDRLSGRTTFMEYTTKKHFRKNLVTLQPNTTAIVDGRKFKTSCDLKEALDYVKNNNIKSTKPVIIIDDLELWHDQQYSLLNNMRALINFIETESDEALVIAAITLQMQSHLDNRLDLSNRFTNIINCNNASKEEITQAIQLRHGAAHRQLMTDKLEPMSEFKVQMMARKLGKQAHGNIGETLQSWTYQTIIQDDEKVLFKESYYEFLDFFTQQERIVLKQALLFKKISEVGLKRVLANAYDSNYQSALRRLINTKVLLRTSEGNLFINQVVVNDITRIVNKN